MTTSDEESSQYLHGSDPEEQARLSLLNDLLNRRCLDQLNLQGGEKILDVACGLGQFSRLMARTAGAGSSLLGVERDSRQIQEALAKAKADGEEGLIEIRQGDAESLPLKDDEWGSFDLVHSRFLVEHLPDPILAVKQMVRAAGAGGRIVLMDDNHDLIRLWPEPKRFNDLWLAYMESFSALGNDPFVGRRLVELLHQAGASPRGTAQISHNSCAGAEDFAPVRDNLIQVIRGARDTIVEKELMTSEIFDAAIDDLIIWSRRPDAAIWYGMCWAEAVKS
jgi:ubiquinone/menaquinone biosynthesis C-methylase UbiE